MSTSNRNTFLKAKLCASSIFLAQFAFALPVLDLNNKEEIQAAANQYINLPKIDKNSARSFLTNPLYAYQADDKESFNKAYQFKNLIDNELISIQDGLPVSPDSINTLLLKAFNQSKPDSAEKLESLINAYKSALFKSDGTVKDLISLADSLHYGSQVQAALHESNESYVNMIKNRSLSFLGNWIIYYPMKLFSLKPFITRFLASTWRNGAIPTLYNAQNIILLDYLSCAPDNKYLLGHIELLEYCKTHETFNSLVHKGIGFDFPLFLPVESKKDTLLIPVHSYKKIIEDKNGEEDYNGLHHLINKIITDRTEGALFFILFKGEEKYQFFSIGTYHEKLSLTYVVDDNIPTPILNFLMPLKGIDVRELADGIHAMLNQDKNNARNLVPDLQGVWLMKGQ